MTEYGQDIDPKWYREQSAKRFTKMGFAHLVHRILMQVGMTPLRPINPFDLEDLSNAEYPVTTNRSDLVWHYDFPDDGSYTIDNVEYRPVLIMYVGSHAGTPPSSLGDSEVGSGFFFHLGYRRADRILRDDVMTLQRLHRGEVLQNFGLGAFNDSIGVGSCGYPRNGAEGSQFQKKSWKMYASSADANRTEFLNVKNIHVILGKGGLTVQVGSGVGKNDSNDILSFTMAFGGARIPQRARIPAQDPNLNRICPVFMMPHAASTSGQSGGPSICYWSTSLAPERCTLSGGHPVTWLLGVQHNTETIYGSSAGFTTRPGAVLAHLMNLENIQRPFFPIIECDTKTSPRQLTEGGAHIMQRIVYTPWSNWNNPSDFIGAIDSSIRAEPTPPWEDIFACPNLRFCDRTAPFGEYEDPLTNENWFMFRASGPNQMMGTNIEGITKYATAGYFPGTYVETDDDHYTLVDGNFVWLANAPHAAVGTEHGVHTFSFTPATDEAIATGIADGNVIDTRFVFEAYGDIGANDKLRFSMELFWKSASAQSPSTNPLSLMYSTDNGSTWQTIQVIYNTGNDTGADYNSYKEIPEFDVPVSLNGKFYFRLVTQYTGGAGGTKQLGIREMHIKTYTKQ